MMQTGGQVEWSLNIRSQEWYLRERRRHPELLKKKIEIEMLISMCNLSKKG